MTEGCVPSFVIDCTNHMSFMLEKQKSRDAGCSNVIGGAQCLEIKTISLI